MTIGNAVESIGNRAFYGCSGLSSVTLGNSVTSIGYSVFSGCSNIRSIHSNNPIPPKATTTSFQGVKTANCILYVPTGSKNDYAFADVWSDFVHIEEEEVLNVDSKIEKPTITLVNSKLSFSSSVEGATYIYQITANDNTESLVEGNVVELSATYEIVAYTKTESGTSEPTYATIHWINGTLTDDGNGIQPIEAKRAVLISSNDGVVTLSGLNDGESVSIYSTEGKLLGQTRAASGEATLAAPSSSIAIIKVKDQSMKVVVK